MGTVRNALRCPRSAPSVGTAKSPSFVPPTVPASWFRVDSTVPSVEIHRLPAGSNSRLSGQDMALTWDLS
jgi:hypothetical protein